MQNLSEMQSSYLFHHGKKNFLPISLRGIKPPEFECLHSARTEEGAAHCLAACLSWKVSCGHKSEGSSLAGRPGACAAKVPALFCI